MLACVSSEISRKLPDGGGCVGVSVQWGPGGSCQLGLLVTSHLVMSKSWWHFPICRLPDSNPGSLLAEPHPVLAPPPSCQTLWELGCALASVFRCGFGHMRRGHPDPQEPPKASACLVVLVGW